ncbi:hypothetical protein NC652_037934 [Populus alba x Populus x berolinensis]|nr:hypothetical protein NC652_037934 [Populus alba x Populus x berolinensis]
MVHFRLHAGVLFFIVVVLFPLLCSGIRSIPSREGNSGAVEVLNGYRFAEAPEYRNGRDCPVLTSNGRLVSSCEPSLVHIAMTLDSEKSICSIGGVDEDPFRGSITEWTHRKHSIGVIVGFFRIQTKNLSSKQNWMDQNGMQQDAQIM